MKDFRINNNFEYSYSELLFQIKEGNVQSLILIPAKREVIALLSNGDKFTVPVLPNDQNILRLSEQTNTPLTVKDISSEQTSATAAANFTVIIFFLIIASLFLKKITSIANKSFSFISGKSKFLEPGDVQTRFQDLAGLSYIIDEVKEIVLFLQQPDHFKQLGAKIPKGFLLYGPPGTGKTLLARAIAGEASVPFLYISGSEFIELFIGLGASRVKNIFNIAKTKAPCIIYIDEIDSIGRARSSGFGGGNDEREQTLNQLLTEMDGFESNSGIVVLGSTNRFETLDKALIRPGRFDRQIEVGLPDKKERNEILCLHALSKPLSKDVDFEKWASKTPGFTGADLSNLLNESAILAARENRPNIQTTDIDRSLDRITMGLGNSKIQSYKQQKIIAYYEIGRAFLAQMLPYAKDIDKISILRQASKVESLSRFTPKEDIYEIGSLSKKYLKSLIIFNLGGRAIETLVFGELEVTQISYNHLIKATDIARAMVTQYGFSTLGANTFPSLKNADYLGIELLKSKSINANKTNKEIDYQIKFILKDSLNTAINLLRPHLNIIDKLVSDLIEEEVFTGIRFKELLSIYSNNSLS